MATKDKVKNRTHVVKSRQKLINSIGIYAYRKEMRTHKENIEKNLKPWKSLILEIEEVETLM